MRGRRERPEQVVLACGRRAAALLAELDRGRQRSGERGAGALESVEAPCLDHRLERALAGETQVHAPAQVDEVAERPAALPLADEGIHRALAETDRTDLAALETIPVPHPAWKLAGWVVPAAILGALVWLGVTRGGSVAGEKFLFWALATGLPSGLGALAAAGHPMTVLAALVAAPITTLHPLLGAGYVTALVQAYFCPPRVADFERVFD